MGGGAYGRWVLSGDYSSMMMIGCLGWLKKDD
jgi:hypothetical protein